MKRPAASTTGQDMTGADRPQKNLLTATMCRKTCADIWSGSVRSTLRRTSNGGQYATRSRDSDKKRSAVASTSDGNRSTQATVTGKHMDMSRVPCSQALKGIGLAGSIKSGLFWPIQRGMVKGFLKPFCFASTQPTNLPVERKRPTKPLKQPLQSNIYPTLPAEFAADRFADIPTALHPIVRPGVLVLSCGCKPKARARQPNIIGRHFAIPN